MQEPQTQAPPSSSCSYQVALNVDTQRVDGRYGGGSKHCMRGFYGPHLEVVPLASVHVPLTRPLATKQAGKCADVGPGGREGL